MLPFEVIIDSRFALSGQTPPPANKSLLSLVNGFEDGAWRTSEFEKFVWDNVAQTALSAKERSELVNNGYSALVSAAKNLRLTDKGPEQTMGSELAEIILYGILRDHYHALPVVPKVFYKQNSNDNAKGADSVHIVVNTDNTFTLWFGEAKFYSSIEDARLSTIIASIGQTLQTDKLKKENSIIRGVSDIDSLIADDGLRGQIRAALSNKESIDSIKPFLHIPILLVHECSLTKSETELSHSYRAQIEKYHRERAQSYFSKQLGEFGKTVHHYEKITFHLILIPVPDKKTIVERFIKKAEMLRS